jgi:hypothetical protein
LTTTKNLAWLWYPTILAAGTEPYLSKQIMHMGGGAAAAAAALPCLHLCHKAHGRVGGKKIRDCIISTHPSAEAKSPHCIDCFVHTQHEGAHDAVNCSQLPLT